MAYSERPGQIDYFAYHEWVDTPAKMVAGLVQSRLEASGRFAAVLSDAPEIRTEVRIDSELRQLLQTFDGERSAVSLTVKLTLVAPAGRRLIATRVFDYRQGADSSSPEGGVSAAQRLVGEFLDDMTLFVTEAAGSAPCDGAAE
jgi:cholesterol transport system auxiliary component